MGVIDSVSLGRSEGKANYVMEGFFLITYHLKILDTEFKDSQWFSYSLEIFLGAVFPLDTELRDSQWFS